MQNLDISPDLAPAGLVPVRGLTSAEVATRKAAGQSNVVELPTGRTYSQILRENVFSLINGVFFVIAVVLIILNRTADAVTITLIIIGGSSVNLWQELRAKWKLDQIALLTRPQVTAIRDGKRQHIMPEEIVLGDMLWLGPGDQIVVDGIVVGEGLMDVDESLLTGESDLIPKRTGDEVHSGSFCVNGSAVFEATKVGASTLAHQLTSGARAFRRIYTPLQREITLVIQVLLLVAIFLWIIYGILYGVPYLIGLMGAVELEEAVQIAAVIAGLVPAGLYLAITLAYALGAVRLANENAVIQQANAIESLSNVDVLCLDKTGTLTTHHIQLDAVYPIGITETEARSRLGQFAATVSANNRTNEAIRLSCSGTAWHVRAEVPFSSALKWSGLTVDHTSYILGAPEILLPYLNDAGDLLEQVNNLAAEGYRVVLFARTDGAESLRGVNGRPQLPSSLKSLAIVTLSEEMRPNVRETLNEFAQAGVAIKVISGDNPQAVAVLARRAGLNGDFQVVSGLELATMDPIQFSATAQECTVFGRVTPEQKSRLIQCLREEGSYVAMTGDGVNDVLSLKQANLSIAMESGSQITRSVADIILLKDSFAALPHAFIEGQRIRNGVQDVVNLFLVRISTFVLLILAIQLVTNTFPLLIRQNVVITMLVVGIPTIGVAIWAKAGKPPRYGLVRSALHFVLPATLTLAMTGLVVFVASLLYLVIAISLAPISEEFITRKVWEELLLFPRSALVTILVYCGLLLLPFLKPPTRFWVAAQPYSGDWRYTLTGLAMLLLYFIIVAVPALRDLVDLVWLGISVYFLLGIVAVGWGIMLRTIWRRRLLDRFLGVTLG